MVVGSIKQLLRAYWRLSRAQHRLLFIIAGTVMIVQMIAVCESSLILRIVQDGQRLGQAGRKFLLFEAGGLFGMLLIQSLLQLTKNHLSRTAVVDISHRLREHFLDKLLRLDGEFHESENTGELVGNITRGIDRLGDLTFIFTHDLGPLVFMFLATVIAVLIIQPLVALIIVPAVTFFVITTSWSKMKKARQRLERHAVDRYMDRHLGSVIALVRTVWTFGQEARELARHQALNAQGRALLFDEYGLYDRVDFWRTVCINLCRIGIALVCVFQSFHDPLGVTGTVLILMLTERLMRACYTIGSLYDRMIEAIEPVASLMKVLDAPITIRDPEQPLELPRQACRGAIEIRDLRHTYAVNDQPTLHGIDLKIKAGSKIGIVGTSGGGKSTLAKTLMRFVLFNGEIRIDGVDIRQLRLQNLRRLIGYVSQDSEIFNESIADNIRYGAPEASLDEVIRVARLAHLHHDILRLPRGYDTRVGDRGFKLSGGQRQRVAIARAFLIDPPIILLDEATASIDAVGDVAIHAAIETLLSAGKTVITIAHRLSAVRNADAIYCLHKGTVIEQGTHDELLEQHGAYAELWKNYTNENPDGLEATSN